MSDSIGIVIIGRNEGPRLARCLAAIAGRADHSVYVDSGSTDGSVELARSQGVEVVELDLATPFTAARARNAGFDRLRRSRADLAYVQFLDGDCEMSPGWLDSAREFLRGHTDVAIAGGRVRERYPERSIYNRLCDLEWNTPIGQTHWCGGNVMIRADAFAQVGGFDPSFIAGEEPELCVRLRERGWTIYRIDADVALHDADMHRFGQWWRRAVRHGYACAHGASLHGHRPERYWARDVRGGWIWGLLIPFTALLLAWPTRGWSLAAMLLLDALLFCKVAWNARRRMAGSAMFYAAFVVLAKWPQAIGQLRFVLDRQRGARGVLIEYK